MTTRWTGAAVVYALKKHVAFDGLPDRAARPARALDCFVVHKVMKMNWHTRKINLALLAFIVCCMNANYIRAQDSEVAKPIVVAGNNCESNKVTWDLIAIESNKNQSTIIMIARLGDEEHSRKYNHRRLHNIFTYLRDREIPNDRLVRAEGERVSGLGRVDVYLNGRLFAVFPVPRNADLAGGSCENLSPMYYPMPRKRSR
jgi:hypothetical protein